MRIESAATSIPCRRCGAKMLTNCYLYVEPRFGQRTLATHRERVEDYLESIADGPAVIGDLINAI